VQREEYRQVVPYGDQVLLIILNAVLQTSDEAWVESRPLEVKVSVRHAVDFVLQSIEKVDPLFAEERPMSIGEYGWCWSKILNSRGGVGRPSVRIREHREDIGPIFPENLSQVSISVNLLRTVVLMEVLSPAPIVDWRGTWNGRDYSVELVRSQSVRIVKEHYELEYRLLVVAQVNQGSISHLASDVGSVNTVISAGVVNISSEELCVCRLAIKDSAQQFEGPPRSDNLLTCFAQVLRKRLDPSLVRSGGDVFLSRTLLFKNVLSKILAGDAFELAE
jgi:hypothetical protein